MSSRPYRNHYLLRHVDARRHLLTPALLLDLPAFEANLSKMAELAEARAISLRPHVKAHKCLEIGRRQIAAGAIGLSCATLGECEMLIEGGLSRGLLLTSPIVTRAAIERLVSLGRECAPVRLSVVVESLSVVLALSQAARSLNAGLGIFVDFAAGYDRTGVNREEALVSIARAVRSEPNLHLLGLQAYAGHIQHISDRDERSARAAQVRQAVAQVIAIAADAGIHFAAVTGVGTGTQDVDGPPFTEFQVGSYLFVDVEYEDVLGADSMFRKALFLQASVVSREGDRVTVDAGTKSMASNGPLPRVHAGSDRNDAFAFAGDEHGRLICRGRKPELGEKIEFLTPHCDPTVNLHSEIHAMDGDELVAIWPIDRRR